jgi:hypothetical protein
VSFESNRHQFKAKVATRLQLGAQDVARAAQRNLGGGGALTGSVRVERLGPGRWRIGSLHPGAMAQERGAFVRPKRRRALKFAGRFAMHARIPAKHWLSRAGVQSPQLLGQRLRGG